MKRVEMRKKTRLFSLVLASLLVLAGFNTAMAATVHGDGTNDAQVALTKNYMVPAGVTLPAASFGFTYTKDGVVTGSSAYNSTTSTDSTQPDLLGIDGSGDIEYATGLTKNGTVGGKDVYVKQIANIVPGADKFSHAGEYVYTIKEKSATNTSLDAAMIYSSAEYKMHVFVKNNSGSLIVAGAAVYQTKNDAGETGTNAKVDLDSSTLITGSGNGNDFEFTNLYAPTDEVLSISKKVTGDYADMTKAFTMSVKLIRPTTSSQNTFSAVIVDSTTNKPVDTAVLSFSNNTAKDVSMKTDQKLVFIDSNVSVSKDTAITTANKECMPAGLSYSVVESGVTDYSPTAVVTHGGTVDTELSGSAGESFTVNTNTIVDLGDNNTALKSSYHSITITGVIVRIIPAVLMVMIALAGFAIVLRTRREEA